MPRKSKDELKNNNLENSIDNQIKKSNTKKSSIKKSNRTTSKKNNNKLSSSKRKNTYALNTLNKKNTSKASNKSASRNTNKKVLKKDIKPIIEYYDLPYRYNETTVKILAQTPTRLFIYWDISDNDKLAYIKKYGNDFFNKTKPILVVRNKTMNYTFEVEINDFANSWYLHVNDANCDYSVELGRKPIFNNSNIQDYVYITTSNDIEMPNNHILFDKIGKSVFFKNVKNNFIKEVPIVSISFMKKLGKIYDIYDLYKEIYKDEIKIKELKSNNIKLDLSSSNSSVFM